MLHQCYRSVNLFDPSCQDNLIVNFALDSAQALHCEYEYDEPTECEVCAGP